MYALIENQTVVQYPYTLAEFKASYPNTSFAANITDQELTQYGVVRVVVTGMPEYNRITQCVEEGIPVFNLEQNYWAQTWQIRDATAQEVIDRKQQIKEVIVEETQARLDQFAQTRGYDSILSACTYATDPNPKFSQEGQYCVDMRSATWSALYDILNNIEIGLRPVPQSYQEVESELPQLQWPV